MNIELTYLGLPKTLGIYFVTFASAMPVSALAVEHVRSQNIEAATRQVNHLIEAALNRDTTRNQYAAQSQAILESGVASSTLMDPKLKVGFGGLPVDSFTFDDDPMSNLSVGLMQQFERGATLELNHRKASHQAEGVKWQIQVREREVANGIIQLWLELGYLQYANVLIADNQRLMREMERFIQTNYSIGRSEAQDLLNTQLQLNKLDEKRQLNQQMQQRVLSQLSEWLGSGWLSSTKSVQASYQLDWKQLDNILSEHTSDTRYYSLLNQHPMAQIADVSISVNQTEVESAEQAYTPQFGVEIMYAYRQSNNMRGEPASDLVSAYITMDIPLFTDNRQDKNLAAAQYQVGAAQYQKDTLLAQMNAQVNTLMNDKTNLSERINRYQSRLIPQATARTKAVERGYQNNTAQFNDVINSTIDELVLKTELARLITDLNKTKSQLSALLGGFEYQVELPVTQYREQE